MYSLEQPYDRQRENNVAVMVVFTMGHDEIFREKDLENGGREVEHMNTDGGWTGSISDTVVIYSYHSPRLFHPLAMLSTSQKDTPFSCLAMVGLNSLLVRAVARTYNSPSWTRHAFLRLISNSLSRRCTVYTSLIITRVRFYPNYHHHYRTLHRAKRNGEKTWFSSDSRQLVLYENVEQFSLVEFLRRIWGMIRKEERFHLFRVGAVILLFLCSIFHKWNFWKLFSAATYKIPMNRYKIYPQKLNKL